VFRGSAYCPGPDGLTTYQSVETGVFERLSDLDREVAVDRPGQNRLVSPPSTTSTWPVT
jgi:hypothetical protein